MLLSDDESGVQGNWPGQFCMNFNVQQRYAEAVLQLIEVQLAQEEVTESPLGEMKMRNSLPAAMRHSL
ncbi:hypothetical protein ACNKHR_22715 [Shigella flexneri]